MGSSNKLDTSAEEVETTTTESREKETLSMRKFIDAARLGTLPFVSTRAFAAEPATKTAKMAKPAFKITLIAGSSKRSRLTILISFSAVLAP
ncbi:hypothetical protein [Campylobacter blaseri]|uniref:Uncharacterized protein n=1 Tax=Campylobacter blaseri TaxID=2042961 RepID=A0A2P8QYM0_9BACT|nr:hypothetical protein [Campylobacter blaseri]PSM51332.1 hypothetical protein CQ405_08880 [Campylobacter blaseri]PSM52476.1 hypothetical protein CRN67_08885 [Campylobacter blaseri]